MDNRLTEHKCAEIFALVDGLVATASVQGDWNKSPMVNDLYRRLATLMEEITVNDNDNDNDEDTKFTPERVAGLKRDFQEWNGGYLPHEAVDQVYVYCDLACPNWCTTDELEEWFENWIDECEANEESANPGENEVQRTMPTTTTTREVIGYVVKNNVGEYVDWNPQTGHNICVRTRPSPISRGDAHRRLGAFLDENDAWDPEDKDEDFYVAPVLREVTPVESAAKELGGLLTSLCQRHGLKLNLSQEQIERQLAQELTQFGAVAND